MPYHKKNNIHVSIALPLAHREHLGAMAKELSKKRGVQITYGDLLRWAAYKYYNLPADEVAELLHLEQWGTN